jgi:hypothetical protein
LPPRELIFASKSPKVLLTERRPGKTLCGPIMSSLWPPSVYSTMVEPGSMFCGFAPLVIAVAVLNGFRISILLINLASSLNYTFSFEIITRLVISA